MVLQARTLVLTGLSTTLQTTTDGNLVIDRSGPTDFLRHLGRRDASMESHTIRINKKTLEMVRDLAEKAKTTMTAIVEAAVREYEIKKYWEEYYAGYAALRKNPEAWAEFQEELRAWDCTLADGLEDLPYEWDKDSTASSPRRSMGKRSGSKRRT
jgi:hypothetical protein